MKTRLGDGKAPTAGQLALSAATAGAVAGVTGNPAELVLVRMCSDLNKPIPERYAYRNCLDGLYRIVKDEGVGRLFRGLGPNIARSVVMNVGQLSSFDVFKGMCANTFGMQDGPKLHFVASLCAGTFATTVCTPFDVVKSRVQNASGGGGGVMNVIRTSLAKDGPLGA